MTSIFRTPRAVAVAARAAALTAAVVALSAIASAPAAAQGGGGQGRGGGGGAQQAMMLEGITLSEAQTARVDSIRASFREKMRALPRPAQGGQSDSTGMAARRKMTEEQRAAIRSALTPEQARTFDANTEKLRNAPRGGRPTGDR